MIYVVIGEAKPNVTLEQINQSRQGYAAWESSSAFAGRFKTVARYEVVGASPKKTFWVMEADDPAVIHNLVEYFADLWNITAYPVVQRVIGDNP